MRLPKSPEQKRADKAARQARWRANKAKNDAINAHIDNSMGVGPEPKVPMPVVSDNDLATRIRDKTARFLDGVEDAEMLDKDVVSALKLGLSAQAILEARERAKAKAGMQLELAAGIAMLLSGNLPGYHPAAQLEDGNTFEGEAHEVD